MLKFSGKISCGENYEGVDGLKNEDFVVYETNQSAYKGRNDSALSAYFLSIKREDVNCSANNLHNRSLEASMQRPTTQDRRSTLISTS